MCTSAFIPDSLRAVEPFETLWRRLEDEIFDRLKSLATLDYQANAVVAFRIEVLPWYDYGGKSGMWVNAYGVAALVDATSTTSVQLVGVQSR